jgi:small subunit ribosomal protein S8
MTTDPIGDLLVRLKNASQVRQVSATMPYSRMKAAVAEVLARNGYVGEVKEKGKTSRQLEVTLKYADTGRPAISGAKRVSKPSRRMYVGVHDIHPVKRGYGLVVLSTPQGVLSGKEAREKKVGGEILFEIW